MEPHIKPLLLVTVNASGFRPSNWCVHDHSLAVRAVVVSQVKISDSWHRCQGGPRCQEDFTT
jgi:hypothetical protein